jgi:hypothetical protein
VAWVFHSGIFYYGVRKYIYESPVLEDKEQMIADALDVFLAGYERVFGIAAATRRAPVKAVGSGVQAGRRGKTLILNKIQGDATNGKLTPFGIY